MKTTKLIFFAELSVKATMFVDNTVTIARSPKAREHTRTVHSKLKTPAIELVAVLNTLTPVEAGLVFKDENGVLWVSVAHNLLRNVDRILPNGEFKLPGCLTLEENIKIKERSQLSI